MQYYPVFKISMKLKKKLDRAHLDLLNPWTKSSSFMIVIPLPLEEFIFSGGGIEDCFRRKIFVTFNVNLVPLASYVSQSITLLFYKYK